MPLAACLAVRSSDANAALAGWILAAIIGLGLFVFAFSVLQVRRGRWQHVDASGHGERRSLNIFLLLVFVVAAVLVRSQSVAPSLSLALLLAAAIILLALMLSAWCKLSLHMAFAAFAVFVPGTLLAAIVFAALLAPIAWSRRVLGRHDWLDIAIGLLVGAAAGIVFLLR